jgi:hypothetical protein
LLDEILGWDSFEVADVGLVGRTERAEEVNVIFHEENVVNQYIYDGKVVITGLKGV